MFFLQNSLKTMLAASILLASTIAQANPVACFNTNMGRFCMELLERQAPNTVANFINYIDSGEYAQSIFHRSVPGFVIQGGGFKASSLDNDVLISAVTTFDPVVNEFGLSNTRGTVAMAKLGNDPDSATSQWFVNLNDNSGAPSFLDSQNGGFTVFAQIIFDGMTVFDTIAALQIVDSGAPFDNLPAVNYETSQPFKIDNFVLVNAVELHDVTGIVSNSALSFVVETGNNSFYEVRLELIAVQPKIVFELDTTSVTAVPDGATNMATFSAQNRTLLIPSVMINETTTVNNVTLSLTDPANLQFTLVSFE
ncbi:MAG: peptidylprolyl isomerase [Burkholderiales bacterium]|nr:peptidylprolyl isomerase [Burkholderiales bacterium]MDR4517234.1 peptidylprolyl isomerase [Nitrosomonas sp.]